MRFFRTAKKRDPLGSAGFSDASRRSEAKTEAQRRTENGVNSFNGVSEGQDVSVHPRWPSEKAALLGAPTARAVILSLTLFAHIGSAASAAGSLEEGFRNPPRDAKPQVWWHWMYGNVTREGITKDLEQLQKLGIGGVTQFHNAWTKGSGRRPATPKGPVRFMSPEYRGLVQYALKECKRLGMTMGLQICDGFSQTAGPWITPETGMRKLQFTRIFAGGGKAIRYEVPEKTVRVLAYRGTLPVPNPARGARDKAASSTPFISPKDPYLTEANRQAAPIGSHDFIDLSGQVFGRTLTWMPPRGDWVVLVVHDDLHPATNHPASPEGHGLECNKLSSDAVDVVFDNYVAQLIQDSAGFVGNTLQHVLIDSWECGYQSWTDGFAEEFKKRRGYDPMPYLPVLAKVPVNSIEESNRFLCDFRVTLDDLIVEEYYGHIRDRLHARGMQLHAEVLYGWAQMFGSPIRQYGVVDVPMNEIWMMKQFSGNKNRDIHGRAYTGYAATAGHVYGKRIIKDEAFTVGAGAGDFRYVPAQIKSSADYVLCRGTTRFVMHTSTHQPGDEKPGWTHGWNGVNFHRGNTWWPYAGGFIDYLSRCSYMLQQGVFVADVCRYVGQEDTYSRGYGELPLEGLPLGYRADHCDNTVLLERMDVRDGRIVLPDGMSYAVLLLADKKTMEPEVLRKLAELAEKGATIIGPKPEHAPGLTDYPECDRAVRGLADRLWVNGVIRDIPLTEALTMRPDFEYRATSESVINFAHRKLPNADIYFIATAGEGCVADCTFRVTRRYPQVFDPMTGELYDIAVYSDDGERTRMRVELEDQGSRIIVFRDEPLGRACPDLVVNGTIPLSGPWFVSFEAGRGAPRSIRLEELKSWTEHDDFGVRHFSGVGSYRNAFTLPHDIIEKGSRIRLELGEVRDLVEVAVNGESVGILWRAPFAMDITSQVRGGQNEVEIRVINTWVNRLIGDKKVPRGERVCEIVSPDPKWYNASSELQQSGLLGPVRIEVLTER